MFGDIIIKLGVRYGILHVNCTTSYIWFYGITPLQSDSIIEALKQLRANIGSLSKQFMCDCNQKLLWGDVCTGIYRQQSNSIGSPGQYTVIQRPCQASPTDSVQHGTSLHDQESYATRLLVSYSLSLMPNDELPSRQGGQKIHFHLRVRTPHSPLFICLISPLLHCLRLK